MRLVDPPAREVHERLQVRLGAKNLRLEPAHLAHRSGLFVFLRSLPPMTYRMAGSTRSRSRRSHLHSLPGGCKSTDAADPMAVLRVLAEA